MKVVLGPLRTEIQKKAKGVLIIILKHIHIHFSNLLFVNIFMLIRTSASPRISTNWLTVILYHWFGDFSLIQNDGPSDVSAQWFHSHPQIILTSWSTSCRLLISFLSGPSKRYSINVDYSTCFKFSTTIRSVNQILSIDMFYRFLQTLLVL